MFITENIFQGNNKHSQQILYISIFLILEFYYKCLQNVFIVSKFKIMVANTVLYWSQLTTLNFLSY